jgi:uncharacterized protein
MNRKDWLIVALGAAGSRGLTPVRLQKSLFLVSEGVGKGDTGYEFTPYNYGPFCLDIYKDAEALEREGIVEIRREGRRWPEYFLTREGQVLQGRVQKKLGARAAYVHKVVEWTLGLTFPQLVRAIYSRYPRFRENSVFQY